MHANNLVVFLISDFTGRTAETLIDSVVIQFDMEHIQTRKFSNISSIDEIEGIINKAQEEEDVILAYTLVLPELCDYLETKANKYNLPTMDILGPFMTQFSQILNQQPQLEVGLGYNVDPEAVERMNCVDFNIRADDGKDLNKLSEADIVLMGVSRTSKTPLSMYLAHQNYKVANISLSPEVAPPEEIYNIPTDKIIGLTIRPAILQKIRQQRLKAMNFGSQSGYIKLERIKEELDYAQQIMKHIGCRIIDITNTSIEEVASQIVSRIPEDL
ncbi:pyruvate, water dikinase regulatory protein [Halanaerocella petrolearia]